MKKTSCKQSRTIWITTLLDSKGSRKDKKNLFDYNSNSFLLKWNLREKKTSTNNKKKRKNEIPFFFYSWKLSIKITRYNSFNLVNW